MFADKTGDGRAPCVGLVELRHMTRTENLAK
jgi:hypothetical protein